MKNILFLLFALLAFTSCDKKNKTALETIQTRTDNTPQRVKKLIADDVIDKNATTFILVRHAEKEKNVKDPELSKKGQSRAVALARVLVSIEFSGYYTTDFRRTKKTARYVAGYRYRDQDVKIYNHKDLEGAAKQMLEDHPKGVIFVSGHSNSTPAMINILTGTNDWQSLSESDYDNLYIVSVYEDAPAKVLHFKYGEPNS